MIGKHQIVKLIALLLVVAACSTASADEWPQWRGPNRDGVWKEKGLVDKFESDQLEIRWRMPIGPGYSGPTVADGRVYVTDRLVEPKQVERVHCFDWESGIEIWSYEYDCTYSNISYEAGPRAAVTIDEGRAYSLGTMGHLHCFDAGTGTVHWKRDLNDEYNIRMPIWGISSAPLIDDDLLIIQLGGSDGACLVAFDKKSGREQWRALEDKTSYSAPIIVQQAGRRVLVCWTGEGVVGLDPRSGQLYWRYGFPPINMVISIATPVVHRDRLFITSFYDGALMLRLRQDRPAVERIWQRRGLSEQNTDALQSIISTPYLEGDYIYGVDSYGELRCLDAKTGDRIWEDLTATPKARWSTIHMVRNGDNIWMFNERGELIISKLSLNGFYEISRAKLIDPTQGQLNRRGGVCWAHPGYAYKHIFARNDKELVCANLEAD